MDLILLLVSLFSFFLVVFVVVKAFIELITYSPTDDEMKDDSFI